MKNKISILIPHYNDRRILKTIDHINKTEFRNYLKIIIQDAGSDLGLVNEIKKRLRTQDRLISKKDKGIFDGLNILLDHIETDYFTWIGSDDFLTNDFNYQEINTFINKGYQLIQCNIAYFNEKGKTTRFVSSYSNSYYKYIFGYPFYHFGSVLHVDLIKDLKFNIHLKVAADFDFFKRLFYKKIASKNCKFSTIYLGEGGNSGNSFQSRLRGYKDIFKSFGGKSIFLFPVFLLVRLYFKVKSKFISKRTRSKLSIP